MNVAVLLLLSVFVTSLISGVLGMAGGLILMAVLVFIMSVPAAMVTHGAVQAVANGSRAWFLRSHIQWQILPIYLLGALTAVAAFYAVVWLLNWLPSKAFVLLGVGIFPWLSLALPATSPVVITHRPSQFLCGLLVTFAQLTAGASGPLLDLFYVNSKLDRHQIVATKGITQTLGHILKLFFYAGVIGSANSENEIPAWLLTSALVVSIVSTRVGTQVLGKFSNEGFRTLSQRVILALALMCILNGLSRIY